MVRKELSFLGENPEREGLLKTPSRVAKSMLWLTSGYTMKVADIVARGHDEAYVRRVWRMLEAAEYKRRQGPPGVKITSRIISRERRYPIVNGFRG